MPDITKIVELQRATIRDGLRDQTRCVHEALHRHQSFASLMNGTLEPDGYRRLMRRLYGFYVPLDRAIGRALPDRAAELSGYRYAERSDFLGQDLLDLGFGTAEVRSTELCREISAVVTPASLGGVLYVVEGATLGGSGINHAVRRLLGHDTPTGRSFWAWCDDEGKHRWSMMTGYLQTLSAEPTITDKLAQGARETFRALADWLAPLDVAQPGRATVQG